ncbi:hypothetical protein L3X39_04130 [Sabulilitoribacter multivorans]|uniref:DNA topoisomerase IV n=1 Tax=Flaviramulus multivorans TaxID=1304750 RepID=A0ABS9IGS1_9FLAO|nr:hypothetical protein [Flaviramulus multivorans]MCF7559815.1 hypothetical protein [Flaviramulus multivorans]
MRILYFITFICFLSCDSQTDCSSFKNGKFKIVDKKLNHESIIERNDSIQIERNLETGEESKYLIKWSGDCEYSLQITSGSEEVLNVLKDKLIFVKIISTERDGYTFQVEIENIGYVGIQKVKKIQ